VIGGYGPIGHGGAPALAGAAPWGEYRALVQYIGIQRRQETLGLPRGNEPDPSRPVPRVAARATRRITTWRLDRERLVAITAAVAPGIPSLTPVLAPVPAARRHPRSLEIIVAARQTMIVSPTSTAPGRLAGQTAPPDNDSELHIVLVSGGCGIGTHVDASTP
jgi:hypothetical protein